MTSRSSSRTKKLKPFVMFTGYDNAHDKKAVAELGGVLTEDLKECTVLVTDKVRRTAKFLCMTAKGVPIVGPGWIANSKQANSFQGTKWMMQCVGTFFYRACKKSALFFRSLVSPCGGRGV